MAKFTVTIDDKYLPALNEICGGIASDEALSAFIKSRTELEIDQKYSIKMSKSSIEEKLAAITAG